MNVAKKDAMAQIVGSERVSDDENLLVEYSGQKSPSLIVWPISTDEVVKIVKWANKNGVALVPVSSAGPKMRGSSLPKVSDVIIVNLSKMNKILRVDTENKVVMLEPGVTYDKLAKELKKNGLRPLMPLLPKYSKSVLTGCLDREPITTPRFHWDSSDPLLCTETVFGTGDVLRTGSAAGPGTLEEQWESGQAQKNPQGPSQFDPFRLIQGSQGTIGIVTWISMKCEMLPEAQEFLLAQANDLEAFQEFNYALLRRRLVDEHFMLNSAGLSAALSTTKKLPDWTLVLGVSGHGTIADEELEYRLGDINDIANETNVKLEQNLPNVKASELESILNNPGDDLFWKLQVQGECREVMFTTTLDRVQEFYHIFQEVANNVGFPIEQIGAYVQPMVQGTNTHVGFDLYYRLDDGNAVETVISLLAKGQKKLLDEGAYFSRPYGLITDAVFEHSAPGTVDAMKRVKAIFDPNNILNPGTLCFKEVP